MTRKPSDAHGPSKLTWVVPCYNEARRLMPDDFLQLCATPDLHLLFVDDGSTDATAALLAELCARSDGKAAYLKLERNQGKAEAVRRGLLSALDSAAEVVGYLDADLSTPVAEALRLGAELAARPEIQVVLASRVRLLGNDVARKAVRHYLGRVFATAASATLGLAVYDTQCGAKLFRATPALRRALAEPFLARWVFDVELLGRLLQGGMAPGAFLEVPLRAWKDVQGSKLSTAAMARAALDLVRIRARLR